MSDYKVIAKEVTSVVWRDVDKAAKELASDVNAADPGARTRQVGGFGGTMYGLISVVAAA